MFSRGALPSKRAPLLRCGLINPFANRGDGSYNIPNETRGGTAMPFQVTCPKCTNILEIPESLVGKQVRCATCQQVFIIGKPQAPASAGEVRISTTQASRQLQAASPPPVLLRPAPEPPPRRPRRPSRAKIPPVVWIVGGCAIGVFCMIALAVAGFIIFSVSKGSDAKPNAVLQMDVRQDVGPPPQFNPPQMPDIQPPNGPPFGRIPGNIPPGNMPPGRNPGQRWPVTLSNGRLGGAAGFHRTITISYQFVQGEPAPGQHYFVVIKTPHSSAEAQIMSFRMAKQGTFRIQEIGLGARDDGPFEAHLETGMPGPFGQREVVSNTITLSP
jgi:hypothetical protein